MYQGKDSGVARLDIIASVSQFFVPSKTKECVVLPKEI